MSDSNPRSEFDSLLPAVGFGRRQFVVTALAGGFALAVQPTLAQTAIRTDAKGLSAGEVKVPVSDGAMPAYRAQPSVGGPFPVVLVVEEIFGVHEYIKDICRRLAKAGYLAVAPEMFARQGDVSKMTNVQEILAVVDKAPDAELMSDLDACVAWAKTNGGDEARLGVTGFCRGGRTVWLYCAHNPQVRAGVAWYGPLDGATSVLHPQNPLDVAAKLKAPVLGLYGAKDQGIPAEDVEAMRKAIQQAGGASQIHVYAEAGHAFHADYRPTYRKEAAEDGWRRMLDWFRRHGVG